MDAAKTKALELSIAFLNALPETGKKVILAGLRKKEDDTFLYNFNEIFSWSDKFLKYISNQP